jgi:CDP-diglyceride synthetase
MLVLKAHVYFRPDIFPAVPMLYHFIFAVLVIFACVLGDLMESVFKRAVDTKSSGVRFLGEGLGGFLDKYDSMGFAVLSIISFSYLVNFESWFIPKI